MSVDELKRLNPVDLQHGNAVDKRGHHKLTVEERIAIAISEKSSRELAVQYGVHHSRICDIRKEAVQLLDSVWSQRKPGPKPTPPEPEELTRKKEEFDELKRQHELLTMRNDWLKLQLQMNDERDAELEKRQSKNKRKKKAQLKKKKS
jgi:hypothetical protein